MTPFLNNFEAIQARARRFYQETSNGIPGANPVGDWQYRFENTLDEAYDKTVGWAVNSKNIGKWAGAGFFGAALGVGAFAHHTDPFLRENIDKWGPWVAGGAAAGAIALGGRYGAVREHLQMQTGRAANPLTVMNEAFLKPIGRAAIGLGKGGINTSAGLVGPAIHAAGATAGAAISTLAGLEFGTRVLMTGQPLAALSGKGMVASNMLDAYLPNFRNLPANNILKYAPNTSIIRRASMLAFAGGVGSMFKEMVSPPIAPPSAVFDGRFMHHKNDMGAGANYGQQVLGRNSDLMNSATAGRLAAAVF